MSDSFLVEPAEAGRADKVLSGRCPGLGRRQLAELFTRGAVLVNGRPVKKGAHIPAGAEVHVRGGLPSRGDLAPQPEPELALDIVYEDSEMLVLNKPAGMASHPLRPGERGTLANALIAHYPECSGVADDIREAGLAHRLDIGTSGVIAAARNRAAWQALRRAFSGGMVRKIYWALVPGSVGNGGCDMPLKHRGGRMVVAVDGDPDALSAHTQWRVHMRLRGPAGELTLLECIAYTGRMHQVRAHLAHVGAPIVGDALYGGPPAEILGHFLHARALALPQPGRGEPLTVEAPLPPDRQALLDSLQMR